MPPPPGGAPSGADGPGSVATPNPPPKTRPLSPAALSARSQHQAPPPPDQTENLEDGTVRVVPRRTTHTTYRTGRANTSLLAVALVALMATISKSPELLAVGAPFLLLLTLSAVQFRSRQLTVSGTVESLRRVEGDTFDLTVLVESDHDVGTCDIELSIPGALIPHHSLRAVTTLKAGSTHSVIFPFELTHWGAIDLANLSVRVRTSDRFGMFLQRVQVRAVGSVKVALHDERLRSLIEPDRFRRLAGGHTSLDRGDGSELADVREYRHGDPQRWINWRISNRRQEPWVTLRHPDRSTTIVVVSDLLSGDATLQRAVARASEAIAKAHLDIYDKVGVFVSGASSSWVEPQLGKRQRLAISDALLNGSSGRYRQFAVQSATRAIPSEAIVIVVSALEDSGITRLISSLRSQGRALVIIEPTIGFDSGWTLPITKRKHIDLGFRLHRIHAELRRSQFTNQGIPVIPWRIDEPMEVAMREVTRIRRQRGARR